MLTKYIQTLSISASVSACKLLLTNSCQMLFLHNCDKLFEQRLCTLVTAVKLEIELYLIVADYFIITSIYSHAYNSYSSFQKKKNNCNLMSSEHIKMLQNCFLRFLAVWMA